MELHQLFKVQDIIENRIKLLTDIPEDLHGSDNTLDLRFLALQVKTCEIANLTKCYKYSTLKEDISKDKLFARYLDALKFLLSIGNVHSFNIINLDAILSVDKEESLIKIFSIILDTISAVRINIQSGNYMASLTNYIELFARFVHLGEALGFSFDEVYNYYLKRYSVEDRQ
ncbi:dUTP diphosphatase [Alkaliphilus serpentinus]|uniref:Dimeric dUTPase, all-alpha-NTP-PPase (MazG) superfamily n=1 Tax=Alkaliphilus serpentinus TaxID=1482731 RepID=A0A833HMX8_9FIRM|nr:dUTP diphosphatase [Alkaliphilus serpentinus]KAB3528852.1 hypothetical protein F8153_11045 [Alkaliphilus serpentinus]